MDYSLAGLIGGAIGIVIALLNYAVLMAVVTRSLRRVDRSQTEAERADFERRLTLLRSIVLVADVVIFAGVGYWLGRAFGG